MESKSASTPRLIGLATSVPKFKLAQHEVLKRAPAYIPGMSREALERLMPVYENAGIDMRYSCVPPDWYEKPHGWAEKNALFIENAVELTERAATGAMQRANIAKEEIDTVIAVSTTGIATPSLDALLIERMALRRDVERLPVFGLGCAGGVTGLARAADLARAAPGKTVLMVAVELCGLTFRRADSTKANVIATALFGDGAAAAIIRTGDDGAAFEFAGEHSWPDSLDIMGWRVEDDGLGVVFSRDIPALTQTEFRDVAAGFMNRHNLSFSDIDHFVCHPGGAKVLDALEEAFVLETGALIDSRTILREYGNMSAVTVLFVLERVLEGRKTGRYFLSSLGPGFTATFLTMLA
jgi:alkylresorcinol/alkylpyrone synthase